MPETTETTETRICVQSERRVTGYAVAKRPTSI
jgi:hypothetical protein